MTCWTWGANGHLGGSILQAGRTVATIPLSCLNVLTRTGVIRHGGSDCLVPWAPLCWFRFYSKRRIKWTWRKAAGGKSCKPQGGVEAGESCFRNRNSERDSEKKSVVSKAGYCKQQGWCCSRKKANAWGFFRFMSKKLFRREQISLLYLVLVTLLREDCVWFPFQRLEIALG